MFKQFESAINKVTEGYCVSKIIGKSEKQILQVEEPVKTEENEWLQVILKAIVESSCLQITYQAFGKDKKEHEFSTYLLKEYRNRRYAVGYSKRAENILILALDRITNVESCEEKYISDDEFIPEDFLNIHLGSPRFITLNRKR